MKKARQGGLSKAQAAAYKGHATRAIRKATEVMKKSGMSDKQIAKALGSLTAKQTAKVVKKVAKKKAVKKAAKKPAKKAAKKAAKKPAKKAAKKAAKKKASKKPAKKRLRKGAELSIQELSDQIDWSGKGPTPAAQMQVVMAKVSRPAGAQKHHGMANPENMLVMTVQGVNIHYPPGIKEQVATTMVSLVLGPMNDKVWAANENVYFSTQKNIHDSLWEARYKISEFTSAATGGDGNIVIYNGKPLTLKMLAHESGHNLAKKKWGSTSPPRDSRYWKAQNKEQPVSEYGKVSRSEDFAEAVAMYATYWKQELKDKFPAKYAALEELIDG